MTAGVCSQELEPIKPLKPAWTAIAAATAKPATKDYYKDHKDHKDRALSKDTRQAVDLINKFLPLAKPTAATAAAAAGDTKTSRLSGVSLAERMEALQKVMQTPGAVHLHEAQRAHARANCDAMMMRKK